MNKAVYFLKRVWNFVDQLNTQLKTIIIVILVVLLTGFYFNETTKNILSDYVEIFSYENIVHINQSYMVNLNYVKSYDSVSVLLENNFKINIGRKYKEEFKSAFFRYQRKYYHANFL